MTNMMTMTRELDRKHRNRRSGPERVAISNAPKQSPHAISNMFSPDAWNMLKRMINQR